MAATTEYAALPKGQPNHEPGEKLLRVIDLILLLNREHSGLRVAEIAERLEVSHRTVQRYLRALRCTSLDLVEHVEARRGSMPLVRYSLGKPL